MRLREFQDLNDPKVFGVDCQIHAYGLEIVGKTAGFGNLAGAVGIIISLERPYRNHAGGDITERIVTTTGSDIVFSHPPCYNYLAQYMPPA